MSLKQEGDQIWTGHVLKCQPLSKETWAAMRPVPAGRAARVLARTRQTNKSKCIRSVPELEKLRASTLLGVPAAEGPRWG